MCNEIYNGYDRNVIKDIVVVTNRKLCEGDFLTRIERIVRGKPKGIILREKDLLRDEYKKLAQEVLPICKKYNVPCILHSFVEVAIELQAKAIHLPIDQLLSLNDEEKSQFQIIGVSCHSLEDAYKAKAAGCTYIVAGHIFDTDCKKGMPGRGVTFLQEICESVDIPVYAIGGITPENIGSVRNAGAAGACVMSGLMTSQKQMKFNKEMLLLYAVTDRAWVGRQTLYEQIEDALKGGITMVQLREKNMNEQTFIEEAKEIKELCHRYQVPLIINDNLEVALKSGADGVHLGIEDVPVDKVRKRVGKDFIIGATAKTMEQAKNAEAAGADYLGVGAVFSSPTKKNAIRITKEQLKAICESVSIPAVAIGGITLENMHEIKGSGMAGVALVSAIFAAENIRETTARLRAQAEYIVNVKRMRTALTIAGSDSSGGAGIQADIKTMITNGVYAMSAITALTAQNTTGVSGIMEVTSAFLAQQIDAVFEDIRPDAVKIGMVSSAELINCIAERLRYYQADNIVVDPVMIATSGARLMSEDAVETLKAELLPLATIVTPNIPEAEVLTNMEIHSKENMLTATKKIGDTYGCAVLCKGGHSINDANDLLYMNNTYLWFDGKRINNPNTHGTGCTLSSAIASNLAKGFELIDSVQRAKEYVSGALSDMLDLGQGSGPMNHAFALNSCFDDIEMSVK